MSREEVEFLARFLLGEPRIGASEGLVLEALARATGSSLESVRRAYMFTGDLGDLAQMLLSGVRPESVTLQLFRPVRPMLAEMAGSVREAMRECGGSAALEFKYDGVRLQIHKRGEEVRLFTRRLSDVTQSLARRRAAGAREDPRKRGCDRLRGCELPRGQAGPLPGPRAPGEEEGGRVEDG